MATMNLRTKRGTGSLLMIGMLILTAALFAQDRPQAKDKPPKVVADKSFSVDKHFAPSGMMGDINDVLITPGEKGVVRFSYTPAGKGPHEWDYKYVHGKRNDSPARHAGVMWLAPADNWGALPNGGYDLSGLKPNLIRWKARNLGNEAVNVQFVLGGIAWRWEKGNKDNWSKVAVPFGDTLPMTQLGIHKLTKEWTTFECCLPHLNPNFSRVVGGFGWVAAWHDNNITTAQPKKTFEFEVQEVRYERRDNPPALDTKAVWLYKSADAVENRYAPTGHMGDVGDIVINQAWEKNPRAGKTCIRVHYSAKRNGPHECRYQGPCRWAGTYWQCPPNNWGQDAFWEDRGLNLKGYTRLAFWARADKECNIEFLCCGIEGPYGDSQSDKIKKRFTLTEKWTEYEIDLTGANLSHVVGGFGWVSNNADGATFYLSDIRFLK